MPKTSILLINLGTPDNCDPKSVKQYLKLFLNDPRVIDLPSIVRWILVNCIIIPFRYKKSSHAYSKIWTDEGSPLLINTKKLQLAMTAALGGEYKIVIGMRYGNPSIQSALQSVSDSERLIVIPLFPQYASASTGSAVADFLDHLKHQWNIPELIVRNNFYQHPDFIKAYAEIIAQTTQNKKIDCLILSYHGLPERHITKSLCHAKCDRTQPCPAINADNTFCYRAQCYQTSRLIAEQLGLTTEQYVVSFQSRLGRTPWIRPYSDEILATLIKKGVKNIAIACPSFVADCLETLEEINLGLRERWRALGGENFIMVPCLNDNATFVKALINML